MAAEDEDDATIRVPPLPAGPTPGAPPQPRDTAAMPHRVPPPVVSWGGTPAAAGAPAPRRWRKRWVATFALLLLSGAGAGWWAWTAAPPAAPPLPDAVPSAAPARQTVPPPLATPPPAAPDGRGAAQPVALSRIAALPPLLAATAIEAHRASAPTLLRLADNPAVFVLDFPSLEAQGAALNRVAALVEKAGQPRDRVLAPDELAAAIARAGDSAATYYYGHNYRGADLARFFRLAGQEGQTLTAAEAWVEAQYRLARGLVPDGQEIAVISVAAPGPGLDMAARASILRHEIGHGRYATDTAYAAHVRRAWRERVTEAERAAFRAFLAREGYDTSNEELVTDEAQAYLLHTPDPRFFAAGHLGMSAEQLASLRARLREGAPHLPD